MAPAGLLDALADAVLLLDRERRVVGVNRRYLETFGARRVDLLASACTEVMHQAQALNGQECCQACEVFEARASRRRLRWFRDSQGGVRRFEAIFGPIHGAEGEVTHVAEVWRDISERGQLEVQLSHSERLAALGTLAAGAAHEINNPLASILACADGLARWLQRAEFDAVGVDEAREILEMLEGEVARCRDITEKLVVLGRSYDAAPVRVDLNRALRDTLVLLRHELRKRHIEVVEDLDPALPEIWARDAALRGACLNLMLNAVEAMSGGGRLTMTTRLKGEGVTLVIEDTGPGISSEHLHRIWDPFFTTKPVGKGTGLGLSITHQIVEQHGGRIGVDSAPGRGTRFTIEVPIQGTASVE
jgi:PAS domain S-box-containing protein